MRQIAGSLLASESLERQDLAALFLLGDALNTYILAREQLFKDGLFFNSTVEQAILPGMEFKGIEKIKNIKPHPALRVAQDSYNQVTKLLIEFNLTPRSRKKPENITPLDDTEPFEPEAPIDKFVIGDYKKKSS